MGWMSSVRQALSLGIVLHIGTPDRFSRFGELQWSAEKAFGILEMCVSFT
jgi:hypothetical protein